MKSSTANVKIKMNTANNKVKKYNKSLDFII